MPWWELLIIVGASVAALYLGIWLFMLIYMTRKASKMMQDMDLDKQIIGHRFDEWPKR